MPGLYKVTVLRSDGTAVAVVGNKPSLKFLQHAVGGHIQQVPHFSEFAGDRGEAWANEEGRLNEGCHINPLATGWWVCCMFRTHGDQSLSYTPVLFGDVVFVSKVKKT